MNKAIILVMAVLIAGVIIFSGCTQVASEGATKITSDKDAAKAVADIGSDISGIKNSLNEVDNTLTDQNSLTATQ